MNGTTLVAFVLIGFFAQMINGSLGMSYGTLSVAFLLAIGIHPVPASSSVHIAKALTGYVSGIAHWRLGNVERQLFVQLLVSGVAGGITGAIFLTELPGSILRPIIATYLLVTGLGILWQVVGKRTRRARKVHVLSLGAVGGFVDAVGGGGWGPVVTTTLLANGHIPHKSIGSVSFAEAFVATAVSTTLLPRVTSMDLDWQIAAGLIIGGVLAAPLAAQLCGKIPVKSLMVGVGLLVVALSATMLVSGLHG